jgi:hypothetical protein
VCHKNDDGLADRKRFHTHPTSSLSVSKSRKNWNDNSRSKYYGALVAEIPIYGHVELLCANCHRITEYDRQKAPAVRESETCFDWEF